MKEKLWEKLGQIEAKSEFEFSFTKRTQVSGSLIKLSTCIFSSLLSVKFLYIEKNDSNEPLPN